MPGSYGFIAQCNEGRLSKKRPTEFRIDQVAQPFDDAKFNFKKALQKEVLFMFEPAPRRITKPAFQPAAPPRTSPSLVYINVSPIEYGHVLLVSRAQGCWSSRLLVAGLDVRLGWRAEQSTAALAPQHLPAGGCQPASSICPASAFALRPPQVPRVLDDLQQLVTPDTLLLALQFAREAGERARGTAGDCGAKPALFLLLFACATAAAPAQPAAHAVIQLFLPACPLRRQPLLPASLQLAGRLWHHQPPALPGVLQGAGWRRCGTADPAWEGVGALHTQPSSQRTTQQRTPACLLLTLAACTPSPPPHHQTQAYYLAAPYAMERAPTAPLDPSWGLGTGADSLAAASPNPGKARRRVNGGVRVEQLAEYPVRTLVFEAGDSLQEVSAGGSLCRWAVGRLLKRWQHGGGDGEA